MANHMMIDLETLDTRPTGVVFQVGVICFADVLCGEPVKDLILEEKIFHVDILYQIMNGRTIDPETVKWWMTQDPVAWMRHPEECITEQDLFGNIAQMMGRNGVGDVWSNSPSFDAVMMRSIQDGLRKKGIQTAEFPSFRNDMDMRTLKQICRRMRFCEFDSQRETTHNALQDCRDQVNDVVMMLRQIRDIGNVWQQYVDGKLVRQIEVVTPCLRDHTGFVSRKGYPMNRIQQVTELQFKVLLSEGKIRAASLDDVEGTHHKRPLYRHPRTGQWFVAVK